MPLKICFIVPSYVVGSLEEPMNRLTPALIAVNTLGLATVSHDWLSANSRFVAFNLVG